MTVRQANEQNLKTFSEYGASRRTMESIYNCTLCLNSVSIERSFSVGGKNLFCCDCLKTIFGGNLKKAFDWAYNCELGEN